MGGPDLTPRVSSPGEKVSRPPRVSSPGMAVQVDPVKLTLKAPGAKRLKLTHDSPLLNFAFNFNVRRYTQARRRPAGRRGCPAQVRRCRFEPMKPVLKAPGWVVRVEPMKSVLKAP